MLQACDEVCGKKKGRRNHGIDAGGMKRQRKQYNKRKCHTKDVQKSIGGKQG